MMRSVVAVIAGYLVMAACVIASTVLVATLMLGSAAMDGSVRPTPSYLIVNLAYSFVFALFGGYVAAFLARRQPTVHAAALAVVVLAIGLLSAREGGGSQPSWYPPLLTIGVPVFATFGGYLRALQLKMRAGVPAANR